MMRVGEQAQFDEPFFSVVEAVVFECAARPGKHLSASSNFNPCPAKLLRFFALSHSLFHLRL